MTIRKLESSNPDTIVLKVNGSFGIDRALELRRLYKNFVGKELILDFEECTQIDSTGLGLLLNLRKNLPQEVTIKLTKCPKQMAKVLAITRFSRFFEIDIA